MTHEQLVEEFTKLVTGTTPENASVPPQWIDFIESLITTTAQRVREETIEEVKSAFYENFRGAGELWFPYGSGEHPEDIEEAVDTQWENVLSTLNK